MCSILPLFSAPVLRAELPPLPQPVTSFGAAVLGEWLYVYGGNTGKAHEFHLDSITRDLLRIKLPDGSAWESLGKDTPLLGPPMTVHGGTIYRIGGLQALNAKGEKNDLRSSAEVKRLAPEAHRWEVLAPLPEPRSSHDVAILDDVLYVGGGWRLNGGDVEEKHPHWHERWCRWICAPRNAVGSRSRSLFNGRPGGGGTRGPALVPGRHG